MVAKLKVARFNLKLSPLAEKYQLFACLQQLKVIGNNTLQLVENFVQNFIMSFELPRPGAKPGIFFSLKYSGGH